MDESFIRTKLALLELGELGYREVWLGNVPNPHWDARLDNFVIAAPKCNMGGWPSLWAASDRNFGRMGCGNGLPEADQCQRELVRRMIPGHYFMEDGRWVPGKSPDHEVAET